ncbi:MAG: hypothetical protein IPP44_14240 [Ideonella sp.]|nr:hypothetical protein [Ideonella sp.]
MPMATGPRCRCRRSGKSRAWTGWTVWSGTAARWCSMPPRRRCRPRCTWARSTIATRPGSMAGPWARPASGDQPRHYTLPVGTLREGAQPGRGARHRHWRRRWFSRRLSGRAAAARRGPPALGWPLEGARVETGLDKPEPSANDLPSLLHNGMVQPLVPLRIRGAIWYQGESNVGRAAQYVGGFQRLITDLRRQWGQGAFPFYFVQLASFLPLERNDPNHSPWAELRDAQRQALALPRTGMAVATDVGNANDIHPRNKRAVGERLALHAARCRPAGAATERAGVHRAAAARRPGGAELAQRRPAHRCTGAALRGFSIADASQRFRPAQARIEGGASWSGTRR